MIRISLLPLPQYLYDALTAVATVHTGMNT
jgi:hypothetical protein